MHASSMRIGISALVALALSLTAVSTALASADHASGGAVAAARAPSQDHDQDQAGDEVDDDDDGDTDSEAEDDADSDDGSADHGPRGRPNHPRFNGVAAVNELCIGDGDSDVPSFDIPSLDVLCSAYRILSDRLPPQVLRGFARAIAVHAGQVAPGWRDRTRRRRVAATARSRSAAAWRTPTTRARAPRWRSAVASSWTKASRPRPSCATASTSPATSMSIGCSRGSARGSPAAMTTRGRVPAALPGGRSTSAPHSRSRSRCDPTPGRRSLRTNSWRPRCGRPAVGASRTRAAAGCTKQIRRSIV